MLNGIIIAAGILIIAAALVMTFKNERTPEHIGVKNGKLAEVPSSPNAVSSTAEQSDKSVEPLPFQGTREETKQQLLKVLDTYENAEVVTKEENYIHAVFSSKRMKFKDDFELYLDEEKEVVEVRSAARVGYSDFDVNRKRYEEIKRKYQEQS